LPSTPPTTCRWAIRSSRRDVGHYADRGTVVVDPPRHLPRRIPSHAVSISDTAASTRCWI
jgi:KaiC/GvpD/RAD55 family RecA-like ATPase